MVKKVVNMKENESNIIALLLREVISQYNECCCRSYDDKEAAIVNALEEEAGLINSMRELNNWKRVFNTCLKIIDTKKVLDKKQVDELLNLSNIPHLQFDSIMYIIIANCAKRRLSISTRSVYSEVDRIEIIDEVSNYPYSFDPIAKGKINFDKLTDIFDDYTLDDIDIEIETMEEMTEVMESMEADSSQFNEAYECANRLIGILKYRKDQATIATTMDGTPRQRRIIN